MTFKQGESGNPKGRPKGKQNKRTIVRNAIEKTFKDGEAGFWQSIAVVAKEGDLQAISMLASRLTPPFKPVMQEVTFNLHSDNLYEQALSILRAVSESTIPPDIGISLMSAINSVARTKETIELEARISILEANR